MLGSVTGFVTHRDYCCIFNRLLCLLKHPHRIHNVSAAHDGVTLKHRAGLLSADLHDYTLCNSSPAKVAGYDPAEVMEDQARVSGSLRFTLFVRATLS
jgi:hypothetical protein